MADIKVNGRPILQKQTKLTKAPPLQTICPEGPQKNSLNLIIYCAIG
jgi:hypothetical protein